MANFINDDYAIYDLKKHRYLVTPYAVEETLGISLGEVLNPEGDINPATLPERFIDFASLTLYTYIYSFNKDKDATEYYISLPRFREGIIDAQIQLIYSFLLNNKPLGVYYSESPEELVQGLPKQILINYGLLNRSSLILNNGYKNTRGVDY